MLGRWFGCFARIHYAALVGGLLLITALPASASTINWIDWTNATTGSTAGSAAGTISALGLTVSYTGEVESLLSGYPSWTPSSSYVGGSIGNAPPEADNSIQLFGATLASDTITFSSPVVDPVMAIWSLGSAGAVASFSFSGNEPFTIAAGGPSVEYGGSSIYLCGAETVCGAEGNGTIQFSGTYSSLTWTNPSFEDFYAFTAGVSGAASQVPEPSSFLLIGAGLLGLAWTMRRKFLA